MNLELPDAPALRLSVLLAQIAKTAIELGLVQPMTPETQSPAASERWIPTAEAAARLGVTRRTLLRYKARGMLHAAKIGRSDRYSTKELDALPEIIQKGPWR